MTQTNSSAPAATVTTVPERPALAPNVRLFGELQGAGLQHRQWLIQRDGRYLQVTELLYRILELANGERTLEEIPAGVTAATDWIVSADQVRHIVQTTLLQLGLVAGADGSVPSWSKDRAPSPLTLTVRKQLLGPRLIDPIAGALRVFYARAVLLPVLLLIAPCSSARSVQRRLMAEVTKDRPWVRLLQGLVIP